MPMAIGRPGRKNSFRGGFKGHRPKDNDGDAKLSGDAQESAVKTRDFIPAMPTVWYNAVTDLSAEENLIPISTKLIEEQRTKAEGLYQQECAKIDAHKRGEEFWVNNVAMKGTSADRSAALTLQVQSNPVYKLSALDSLLAMANKKSRHLATMAVASLKDLFLNTLLPSRKLQWFEDRALSHPQVTDKHLLYWYFEDQLKKRFRLFLDVLEQGLRDTVAHHKRAVLQTAYDLLVEKPEGEKTLLDLIINKLGDPDKHLASLAAYLLTNLMARHPKMKSILVSHVETFLFRPNLGPKAQYYAIIFLTQIILTRREPDLAQKLIEVYFAVFKILVHKGDVDSRMLGALLTGVNRAFPFAPHENDAVFDEHMDMLFKIVHTADFNKAVKSLFLIYQVMSARHTLSDRFYRALYDTLLSPSLQNCTQLPMYLNLLYKSLKIDKSENRVKAFVKRILQACFSQQPPFTAGCLFMISELMKTRPGVRTLIDQPNEETEYVPMHKPVPTPNKNGAAAKPGTQLIKKEPNQKNVATAKAVPSKPKATATAKPNGTKKSDDFFGKSGTNKDLKDMKLDSDDEEDDDEDNDEEKEAKQEKQEKQEKEKVKKEKKESKDEKKAIKKENADEKDQNALVKDNNKEEADARYDPWKREPMFAGAEKSRLWELTQLCKHYHPSVAHMANTLAKGEFISYDGDPLSDFTLTAFLDRFMYKNAKKKTPTSIMAADRPIRQLPAINTAEFLAQKELPHDELFFQKYFRQKAELDTKVEKKPAKAGDEEEGEDEEEKPHDIEEEEEDKEEYDYADLEKMADASGSSEEEEFDEHMFDDIDSDDPDVNKGSDQDDEYDDEEEEEEEDEDGKPKKANKAGPKSTFASVEEFADLLEASGTTDPGTAKQGKRTRNLNKPRPAANKKRPFPSARGGKRPRR